MRNALSKVTAWVLTFMMLFTALPVNIIAEGVQPQGIVEERSVDVPAPQQNEKEVSPASAPSEQESIKEQTPVEPQSVIPDDAFYRTYVFMAEEQEVARQIVKTAIRCCSLPPPQRKATGLMAGTQAKAGLPALAW